MFAKKPVLVGLLCVAIICDAFTATARRENDFVQVQAKDLVKNPQLYWAQGIIFKDTIVTPPTGPARKMGERSVIPFRTKIVGECFADEILAPAMQDVKAGAECLFSGTVFQDSGWFSSKFHIIVQECTASAASLGDMRAKLDTLQKFSSNVVYSTTAQRLDFVLAAIQSDLMAYSAENRVSMAEVFDPKSPHRDRVIQAVRSGVDKLQDESRAPSSVFLSDLLTAMLAGRFYAPTSSTHTAVESSPKMENKENQPVEKNPGKPASETKAMDTATAPVVVEAAPKSEMKPVPSLESTPVPMSEPKKEKKPEPVPAPKKELKTEPPPKRLLPEAVPTNRNEKTNTDNTQHSSFLGWLFGAGGGKSKAETPPDVSAKQPDVKAKAEIAPPPAVKTNKTAAAQKPETVKPAVAEAPVKKETPPTMPAAQIHTSTTNEPMQKKSFLARLFSSDSDKPKTAAPVAKKVDEEKSAKTEPAKPVVPEKTKDEIAPEPVAVQKTEPAPKAVEPPPSQPAEQLKPGRSKSSREKEAEEIPADQAVPSR